MKNAETKTAPPRGGEGSVLLRSPSGEALITLSGVAGTAGPAREGVGRESLSLALIRRGIAVLRRGDKEEKLSAGDCAAIPDGWSVTAEQGGTLILRLSYRLADGCGVVRGDLPYPSAVTRLGGGLYDKLDGRVRVMESERGEKNGFGALIIRSEGAAALAEICRALPGGSGVGGGTDGREREMAFITDVIRENISEPISIDGLAEKAHMSRSRFFKAFRKHTGDTVNDYILKRRIENTVTLITASGYGVLEAAYASGFTSSSGFYKAFRRICGVTPKEYVAAMREKERAQ